MLDAGTASQSEVNAAAKKLSDAVNALKKQSFLRSQAMAEHRRWSVIGTGDRYKLSRYCSILRALKRGLTVSEVLNILNKKSGMLGVTGTNASERWHPR